MWARVQFVVFTMYFSYFHPSVLFTYNGDNHPPRKPTTLYLFTLQFWSIQVTKLLFQCYKDSAKLIYQFGWLPWSTNEKLLSTSLTWTTRVLSPNAISTFLPEEQICCLHAPMPKTALFPLAVHSNCGIRLICQCQRWRQASLEMFFQLLTP